MPAPSIAFVSQSERSQISRIYERRTALTELLLTLDSPDLPFERDALERRIREDLTRTNARFESWWKNVIKRYDLRSSEHGKWMIDFETRELTFVPTVERSCPSCAHSTRPTDA